MPASLSQPAVSPTNGTQGSSIAQHDRHSNDNRDNSRQHYVRAPHAAEQHCDAV